MTKNCPINLKKREIIEKTKNQFKKFVFPSIGAMWFFSLYTMVDGAFVGRGVGPQALAGVNISMPYVSLLFALAILISVGSSNIIAYYRGRGEEDTASGYFSLSLILISILGLGLGALAFFNLDLLLRFLKAEGEIYSYAYAYLKVITPFSVFFMLAYNLEILVKADGNPKLSVKVGIIASLTNIVLDYLLVFVFSYGIKGAALATGISQVLGTCIYLSHFLFARSNLKFRKINAGFIHIFKIIKVGIPEALTELSIGFTTFLYNYTIIKYLGLDYITTYSIIMYVNNLVINTMIAINQGSQPLVSYHKGRENTTSLRELLYLMLRTALIFGGIFFVLCLVFSKTIVGIFIDQGNAELFAYSVGKLKIFSLGFVITGFSIVASGYLTASKHPKEGLIVSILRGYINISLSLVLLPRIFGPQYIWLATIVSEVLTLAYIGFKSIRALKLNLKEDLGIFTKA